MVSIKQLMKNKSCRQQMPGKGGVNMVQRYRPDSDEQERSFEMIPDDGGDYVAHGDYEELEDELA